MELINFFNCQMCPAMNDIETLNCSLSTLTVSQGFSFTGFFEYVLIKSGMPFKVFLFFVSCVARAKCCKPLINWYGMSWCCPLSSCIHFDKLQHFNPKKLKISCITSFVNILFENFKIITEYRSLTNYDMY